MNQHPNENNLALAASGDLPFFTAWTTRRHLAKCDECRATVEEYAQLRVAMSSLPTPEPPADLAASILSRVPRTEPSRGMMWLGWASAAAVAAVALSVSMYPAPSVPSAPPLISVRKAPPVLPAPQAEPTIAPTVAVATLHSGPVFATLADAEQDRDKRYLVDFARRQPTAPLGHWADSAQRLPQPVVGPLAENLRSHALPGRVEVIAMPGSPVEIVKAEASFASGHLIDPVVEIRNAGSHAIKDCQLIWVVRDAAGNEFRGHIVAANKPLAPGARAKYSESIVLAPERRSPDTEIASARVFVRSASTPDSVWVPERAALEARNLGNFIPLANGTKQLLEAYRRDGAKAFALLK